MSTIHMDNGASYEGPRDPEKERVIKLALKAFARKDAGWDDSWGPMPGEENFKADSE
jgi:hypothetical protein